MGFIARAAAVVKRRVGKLRKKKERHRANLALVSQEDDLNPHTIWKEGTLEKKGAQEKSAYQRRHVTLTSEFISYGNPDGGAVLDRIYFSDIAGIGCGDLDEWEWDQHFREEEHYHGERWKGKEITDHFTRMEFAVFTANNSYHRGRAFQFRANSVEDKEEWVASLVRVLSFHRDKEVEPTQLSRPQIARRAVRWFYLGDRCQITVATLICANFFVNIAESEILPEQGTSEAKVLHGIDLFFTYTFAVELSVNMFGTLFWEFFSDAWNWFDSVVVLISLVSVFSSGIPGVSVLRLLRAFRVFRLFKRIPSLRQILIAINQSIPPMLNAFALVCLVTAIYAIMAVTFFKDMKPELFGDFFTTMFTMFQIMTGDQWGGIARELFAATGQGPEVAIFFVSYQLLVSLVLVNVVIAVLLDEFSKAAACKDESGAGEPVASICSVVTPEDRCPFQPLMSEIMNFSDLEDFEKISLDIFRRVVQGAGRSEVGDAARLDFKSFSKGLHRCGTIPYIRFHQDHWQQYAVKAKLVDHAGTLGSREFTVLMKQAFRRHQLRMLTAVMESPSGEWTGMHIKAALLSVKGILLEEAQYARDYDAGSSVPNNEGGMTARNKQPINMPQALEGLVTDLGRLQDRFHNVEKQIVHDCHTDGSRPPSQRDNLTTMSKQLALPIGIQSCPEKPAEMRRTMSLSAENGALTARSRPATARNLNKEGWQFWAEQSNSLFGGMGKGPQVDPLAGLNGLKDNVLGGFGAVGRVFPFLPRQDAAASAGEEAKSPAVEISSKPTKARSMRY